MIAPKEHEISLATHRKSIHLLQGGVLLLLVVAFVVALWPVQREMTRRLDSLKKEIILKLELATGRRITYASISPSVFRSIQIRELEVFDRGTPTVPLVRINRVEITYSIFKLFAGDPAEAVNDISIENSSFTINTQTDADLIRFLQDLVSGRSLAGRSPFPSSIRLTGRNLAISIVDPLGSLSVERLFFQIRNAGHAYEVQLRCGIRLVPAAHPFGLRHAETSIQVNGSIDKALAWSDMRVRFDNLASNLVNVSRPTFRITLRDGLWQLRKVQDNAPLDLQASYDTASRQLRASFVAEGFRPEDYFTFGPDLARMSPWLTSRVSGNASVSYALSTKVLRYDGHVTVGVNNRLVPLPLTLRASVSGDSQIARFAELDIASSRGSAQFTGDIDLSSLLPQGRLDVYDLATPLGKRLSAHVVLTRSGRSLTGVSSTVVVGQTALYGLTFHISRYAQNTEFALAASFVPDSRKEELRANGVVMTGRSPYVQLAATATGLPLSQLYALIAPIPRPTILDSLKGLELDSQVFVATDFTRFSFASPEVVITDPGAHPARRISFRVSGNDRSLDLGSLVVDWKTYHVEGSLQAAYVSADRVRFSSSAVVKGVHYSLEGFYVVNDSLVATGTFGLDLAAVREGPRYIFTLHTTKLPIPFANTATEATLDLQGVYTSPSDWELVTENSTIENLPFFPERKNVLRVSARLTSRGGDIYSMTYADPTSTVSGSGRLSLTSDTPSPVGSGWIQLGGSGGEAYNASFSFKPGAIDASIAFQKAPLARLGASPVTGAVSGTINLKGKITDPQISVSLSLPDGQIYSDPLTASVSFTLDGDYLRLSKLDARYLASTLGQASGEVRLSTGSFTADASYRGDVNGDPLVAHIAVRGSLSPVTDRAEVLSMFTKEISAVATVSDIRVVGKAEKSWSVTLKKNAQGVTFSGGPEGAVNGEILADGSFAVTLGDPLPITGEARGSLKGSTIDASLQNVVLDLHAFDSVMKIPYFDISRGKARGNLEITGPVNDPDISGDLRATEVYGKTIVVPDEIGPFNTDLVFQGKSLSMSEVSLPVGNSQVLGNLDFTIDHWLPSSFELRFTTQSPQGVHVRYTVSDIEFNGYASGTTVIRGDSNGTSVSGNLEISSCVITINGTAASSAPPSQPTYDNTSYDFTFTTGKQVQFVWPNTRLPIVRSYADTGQRLKILSNGNTGAFSIVGDINVRSGEVFYIRQNFYIREGKISFNEDQNKFDPIIYVKAELHEVDSHGKPVTIYLIVDNKPLSQFAPSFESDPAMTNEQILTMLGQDFYSQLGTQQPGLNNAVALTGDLLGQFSIMRTFEDKVKQALNLDLFSVRTDLLQNIIQEKVLGQAPPPTATPGFTLGRYLDNTTLFLGKYFGNDLFLEAMISLTSSNAFLNEFGSNGNLQVESNVLLEWKTPLFLLQLAVQPSPTDFLSSLLNASLSLSWGFSF